MAIQATRRRSLAKRIYEKLELYKLKIAIEFVHRFLFGDKRLPVFYRYKNQQAFLHPLFERNYEAPPIVYSSISKAKLFHWWHSCDENIGYNKPFVIEPIDHVFSIKRVWGPKESLKEYENCRKIYSSKFCKKIITISKGQYDIFMYYFPELEGKLEIVYPACVPRIGKSHPEQDLGQNPNYLCIVSDFKKKGLDIVLNAWLDSELENSSLTIVCTDIPNKLREVIKNQNNIKLFEVSPLPSKIKEHLYKTHNCAIIPMHTDGSAVYVEALEYGLPIITMRSQHSSSFTKEGNGVEIDVPFYLYDVGFGHDWETWDAFYQRVEDFKSSGKFSGTIDGFKSFFESNDRNMSELLKMRKKAIELLYGDFHYSNRNKKLKRIYNEALD